ncbi:hypothetical protein MKK50_15455 [Methylobacterium sp. J-043]|jgi:hypothetical protein|uniref:Septal ring factor EnvC (AmiA/AmiB activator) n=1 Tax=Methylobacterium goesingense TaxID=243690 RepID=A0ABV2L830_9HYPH|nr:MULTISPECIES: hypothetical protein [Methylobacteriaceae]KQQ13860.1 hypothetical protein ASF59_20490 [Methylobacterium sp. Leaf121]MCJ2030770.1 hypothetical protein [Methylobacterium sp. J-043]USU31456.1 hypothetical protein NG677_19310 [Methylobacterium sp. OTU13CASTA1]KQP04950.1 hypothetical protein ASF28_19180 [Methylobacterium sp. Leaf99]KQT49131.1 hypothetical protein ASG52_09140 [Methylobacterium sp. Leaf456]
MNADRFVSSFENGAYGLAAGLAAAHAAGLARGDRLVAEARAAEEEAVTSENLATVARVLLEQRRELAALRAENARLKGELATSRRADAVRAVAVAARRTNARRA